MVPLSAKKCVVRVMPSSGLSSQYAFIQKLSHFTLETVISISSPAEIGTGESLLVLFYVLTLNLMVLIMFP